MNKKKMTKRKRANYLKELKKGSALLQKSDGKIVGVHTNGGCDNAAIGHNHRVRITSIIRESATIAGILSISKPQ